MFAPVGKPDKSWLRRRLELFLLLLVALYLLPVALVLLKPLLGIIALSMVTAVAMRGLGGYVASRQDRW